MALGTRGIASALFPDGTERALREDLRNVLGEMGRKSTERGEAGTMQGQVDAEDRKHAQNLNDIRAQFEAGGKKEPGAFRQAMDDERRAHGMVMDRIVAEENAKAAAKQKERQRSEEEAAREKKHADERRSASLFDLTTDAAMSRAQVLRAQGRQKEADLLQNTLDLEKRIHRIMEDQNLTMEERTRAAAQARADAAELGKVIQDKDYEPDPGRRVFNSGATLGAGLGSESARQVWGDGGGGGNPIVAEQKKGTQVLEKVKGVLEQIKSRLDSGMTGVYA